MSQQFNNKSYDPRSPPNYNEAYSGSFSDRNQPIVVQPGSAGKFKVVKVSLHHSLEAEMSSLKFQAFTSGPVGCLEYLKNVSTLVIKQKVDLVELITDFDRANKFTIQDETGQIVFYAKEDSSCCNRLCFGPARPFRMRILDLARNEVFSINRPLACQPCCFYCCLMNVDVSLPPGNNVGKVQQKWSLITPVYDVENAAGETIMRIKGPWWRCSCGGDIDFKILSADGATEIGNISKTWSGCCQEYFTDADNFKITFPPNLDVGAKATLIGALFLIPCISNDCYCAKCKEVLLLHRGDVFLLEERIHWKKKPPHAGP